MKKTENKSMETTDAGNYNIPVTIIVDTHRVIGWYLNFNPSKNHRVIIQHAQSNYKHASYE